MTNDLHLVEEFIRAEQVGRQGLVGHALLEMGQPAGRAGGAAQGLASVA